MIFKAEDTLKALAIVRVFETSKPFGDYAACAVLNDGAGISYGINQFTHRSGSLLAVVEKYLASGGVVGRRVIEKNLPLLRLKTVTAINTLAANKELKSALRAAAITSEMRQAQNEIAFERYLRPAIGACETFGFVLPLSLAVIYDSMTHGSWERIRSRVRIRGGERAWITEYVRIRDRWLDSIPRLRSTRYRTRFFLNQIMISNWDLRPPLRVQGTRLTDDMFRAKDSAVEPIIRPTENASAIAGDPHNEKSSNLSQITHQTPQAQPPDISNSAGGVRTTTPSAEAASTPPLKGGEPEDARSYLDELERWIYAIAARYDRTESIVTAILTRTDAAKSLWTTIVGTVWQTLWAVFAFLSGMPRAIWFAAAVIVGGITLAYLYRQIALGKIRERSEFTLQRAFHQKSEN